MEILEFLLLLVIAGICGVIGQLLVGVSRGGFLIAIVLGFIGAFLGMWLADAMDLPAPLVLEIGDTSFPLLWSVIGSALFVGVLSLLTGRRRA